MTQNELNTFLAIWDIEAKKTGALLKALPQGKYDFRPDAGGRSLGELAWHLAEGDAYMSMGVAEGGFSMGMKPPGIERPREIAALAPGYERVHAEAVARIKPLSLEQLSRKIPFLMGKELSGGEILWNGVLYHHIHHRGQLSILSRMAGGVVPGMYGPNREETDAMKAAAVGKK